ncbi:MAG: B12-binding domain-containing radical SAM protein [Thermoplasmata archaeon]|nr:MAG: B12-binding domain-containing radical SAM protein [Thermoplasmata archaeon]
MHMKIAFILPECESWKLVFHKMGHPKSFLHLAAVTPRDHEIEIVDERRNKINFNKNYDIVGITTYTANAFHAYEIADKFRKNGVKVVLGGYHVSALPEEAKQHADSVVIGEAEETWPQLLKDFEKGKLKPFYKETRPVDLSAIPPIIDKKRFAEKSFLRNNIQSSRGCPYGCEFCAITNYSAGRIFRTRPIEYVVEELKSMPQKNIWMDDPSLTINPDYTKKLFKAIKPLNKRLMCRGNVDVLSKDDEFLKLASEAGCAEWFVGFESISQENINDVGKVTNKVEYYKNAIKKIHEHGMLVTGSFMFGLDHDRKNVFSNTLDFINEMEIDDAGFFILTPFPGTPLYERLDREKRILTKDWSKYTWKEVVFQPKQMLPEELQQGYNQMSKEFNSFFNRMRRIIRSAQLGYGPFFNLAILKSLP